MKRTLAIALLIAATGATSAFADTIMRGDIMVEATPFVSNRSAAEVQQEYLASQEQVRAMTGEDSGSTYLAQHRAVSGLARAEVQQEYLAAREQVRAMTGEDSGSVYLAAPRAHRINTQLASDVAAAK